jgi:hypothetical protein
MVKSVRTVDDYITFLEGKGFSFQEDALGFIKFGKQYTNATHTQVNIAIEMTLKVQRQFEGAFFMALLETLVSNGIKTRPEAIKYIRQTELLPI